MLSRFDDIESNFSVLDEFRRRLDRVWEDFEPSWQRPGATSRNAFAASAPRINLYDAGANLVLKADLPGMSEKDVQVTLNESGLALSGERKVHAPEGYSAHRQERASFKFSRTLSLPCKVDPERTSASVKNGVLTVTLAKAPEAQPRQITVQGQ